MKCPNCQESMGREDAWRMAHNLVGDLVQQTPTAEYYCQNCGSEYEWQRGQKRLILSFDSRTQTYDPHLHLPRQR